MNEWITRQQEARASDGPKGVVSFFKKLAGGIPEHVAFLRAFIREPANVGALSPSSRYLAEAMLHGLPLETSDTVVELGPGTGAFTGPILQRKGRHTTFIAMELDAASVVSLRRRFAGVSVYHDSAERLVEYLDRHGKRRANCVVSGLPWANIAVETRSAILNQVLTALSNTGVFTTFAYWHARRLPKAQAFRQELDRLFNRVETSSVVWRNFPPALVYRCSSPRKRLLAPRRIVLRNTPARSAIPVPA